MKRWRHCVSFDQPVHRTPDLPHQLAMCFTTKLYENVLTENSDGYENLLQKQLDIIESKDEYNEEMEDLKKKVDELMCTRLEVFNFFLYFPLQVSQLSIFHHKKILDASINESRPKHQQCCQFDPNLS